MHIGICILPVVFNAGMEATGDIPTAVTMTIRVLKSELIPLVAGFVLCDLFGQLLNLIAEGTEYALFY